MYEQQLRVGLACFEDWGADLAREVDAVSRAVIGAVMMRADPNAMIMTTLSTFMRKIQEVTTATGAALRPQFVYGSLCLLLFLLVFLVGIHFVITFIEVLNEQSYDFRLVLR